MKLKKGDCFIILAILFIAALIWSMRLSSPLGEFVEVFCDSRLEYTFPLSSDREEDICGVHLVVRDGKASVTSSSCPDKVCVRSGAISKSGDVIVCVPNKVSIKIPGKEEFDVKVN